MLVGHAQSSIQELVYKLSSSAFISSLSSVEVIPDSASDMRPYSGCCLPAKA